MSGGRAARQSAGAARAARGRRVSGGGAVAGDATMPGPGDTIAGKYSLVRQIGQGGMAVVFEAVHLRLHQRLAIKILRPDVPEFDDVLARFEREARATAQLRSIHTARIVDVDTLPTGLPYIVMEYLEGNDLETILEGHRTGEPGSFPFAIEEVADLVMQVADVMGEAHSIGIVHRDLKPANIFVCQVGGRPLVKVLDFGISRFEQEGHARLTLADSYFGTPCYAAPEQLRDAASADARSDVWSLGIILFELLTGRPPFEGTSTAVIAKVMTDPVPWPVELRPDLPRELARVILRALDRDPAKRFQSMSELAAALSPFAPEERASVALADVQRARGRLGEILVADGLLSAADLKRALDEQRRSGNLLGRVLLDLRLVSHADLLAALAKQQGVSTWPDAPSQPPGPKPHASPRAKARAPRSTRVPSVLVVALVAALGLSIGALAASNLGRHASREPAAAGSR